MKRARFQNSYFNVNESEEFMRMLMSQSKQDWTLCIDILLLDYRLICPSLYRRFLKRLYCIREDLIQSQDKELINSILAISNRHIIPGAKTRVRNMILKQIKRENELKKG